MSKDILLCFSSGNAADIQLALDYWAIDGDTDKPAEPTTNIAARYKIENKKLLATVRACAEAYDLSARCVDCSKPRILTSRTALSHRGYWRYGGGFTCVECADMRRAREYQLRMEEVRRRQERQEKVLQAAVAVDGVVDYSKLDYFDAVLVYSIMLASDDACEIGEFGNAYTLNLCSSDELTVRMLKRLFDSGVLLFASNTPLDAVTFVNDDSWTFDLASVCWRFARDANGLTFTQVFSDLGSLIDLRDSHPSYDQCVADLWWNLGLDDTLHFLLQEVGKYRISSYRRGPKTDEALRHALERFSIPQVRHEIRKVVEKAAALCMTRDYHQRHALNTIPGTLMSYVDRAQSEKWNVYSLFSDWDTLEPVMIRVLFNRVLGTGLLGFRATTGSMLGSACVQLLES